MVKKKRKYHIVVSKEMSDLLVRQKFSLRVRSIDDVLRIKFGMSQTHPMVDHYSHEYTKTVTEEYEEKGAVPGKIAEFQKGVTR